jgi:hypothetical protein
MTKPSTLLLLLAICACKTDASGPEKKAAPQAGSSKLNGVWPNVFDCGSIAAPAALGQLLGAEVKRAETPITMPKGVAAPCVYELLRDGVLEQWQFDFDCRDNYKKTYDALVEQYRKQNLDLIAAWNQRADAGVPRPPPDGGAEDVRPGDPVEVELAPGAKGLDHHGAAIIFVDDDAPCYVRVAGKDTARRLELARLVAKNLTLQNAPMTPRAPK